MKKVFFTGHRIFNASDETIGNLVAVLIKLIFYGTTDFYAEGNYQFVYRKILTKFSQ